VSWLDTLGELRAKGKAAAIITVVAQTGSTPRDIGAKMIIAADGVSYGTIGGGNLEHLAREDAKKVIASGVSTTIKYPLGAKAGQCCGGSVELLFESFNISPKLIVFGAGHVGQAVSQVMEGTSFQVTLVDERAQWLDSDAIPSATTRYKKWQILD